MRLAKDVGRKTAGISEIFIMLVATFAFAFLLNTGSANAIVVLDSPTSDSASASNPVQVASSGDPAELTQPRFEGDLPVATPPLQNDYASFAGPRFEDLQAANKPEITGIVPNIGGAVLPKITEQPVSPGISNPTPSPTGAENPAITSPALPSVLNIANKPFTRDSSTGLWTNPDSPGTKFTDDQIAAQIKSQTTDTANNGNLLQGLQSNWLLSNLAQGLLIGSIAGLIGKFFGKEGSNAGEAGFFAGMAGGTVYGLLQDWGSGKKLTSVFSDKPFTIESLTGTKLPWAGPNAGLINLGIGVGVGVAVFVLLYKEESKEIVSFQCNPWEAPIGGNDCEKCNANALKPCSEYRCKSLGQACALVNEGTGNESCIWQNPKDVDSPTIMPWGDVLTPGHSYTDVKTRPPGNGMRIVSDSSSDGCIKPFTALEFGIETNEPAQCKIDYNHTASFDTMQFYFGESNLYLYNHSQKLRLPSPADINIQAPDIQADGTYTLYTRCRDANGNVNTDEYAIRFCVDKGPDVTPPLIEDTSIKNGAPIQYNLSQISLDVYVNEPATCKWSKQDKDYAQMENTMQCSTNVWEMNNNLLYKCTTTLTGLQNHVDNDFYFRCKDKPTAPENERNVNKQSYKFTLKGTQPLNIISVGPNGTIQGSGNYVPVELSVQTANGENEGASLCYYSTTGVEGSYVKFFETGTDKHKQRQDLQAGAYTYYYRCVDLGGNSDTNRTKFNVEVDQGSPIVTRIYHEGNLLKVITNEKSVCVYNNNPSVACNFNIDNGVNMPYDNSQEHFTDWNAGKTYYIRCADESGNQPLPTLCSIIARPYSIQSA